MYIRRDVTQQIHSHLLHSNENYSLQLLKKGQEARNPDLAEMVSYGKTISTLKREHKTLLRYRENTLKKIINAELAITFNEICLRENLLPIYTLNIYIYTYIY